MGGGEQGRADGRCKPVARPGPLRVEGVTFVPAPAEALFLLKEQADFVPLEQCGGQVEPLALLIRFLDFAV